MITEVIKRDGSVEKFDANKLSKWAEWAGDFGVDWFAIVGDAYKMCHNKCTTKDLHAALVNACLDKRTSPHFLMAGRLMVGELYKDVFGGVDNIPTLPSFYHKMIEEGYWEDMGYSEEELTLLNSVIDHTADFKLSSTQVRQDIQKYLISDVTTKQVKETPQFALMRQAMGAHKHQPSERRLQDVVSAYEDLKKGWINTPTPNKTNLGTHKRSYASCCASMAKDTLGSIEAQNHINYVMTAASAGQGNYLQVRSFGDKVRGGVIKHGGKLPYMRLQQEENRANMQGCYDGQTEILTEIGWVRFDNLQDGLKVAQVFDDGSSNFVVPKAKYVYDYEGEMVTFNSPRRGVDLLVTPNHRMVSWDIRKTQQALKEGEYQVDAHHVMDASHRVTEAADFTASRNNGIRKAVKVVGEGKTGLSAQERFEIAFQADGVQHCTDNYGYTFRFAKERKIVEFEALLSDVGYNYSKTVQKTGVTSFYVNVGKKLSKVFQYNLAEVTWEWAEQFLNEVVKWDGCLTIDSSKYGITYSTTEEKNAAFVQAVAVIAGWHSSISVRPASGNRKPLYKVLAMKDGGVTSSRAWKKSLVPFKGKVYCVEVETGMVVVRRNNMPVVCGNSRGGAVTQHIIALDPEIFTLLALRNPTTVADKRIDKMDYSLQVNESFNERAKKNADWLLISVKDAPDLYEHFFDEDMSVFNSLMDKYIAAGKGEVVKARDVLIQHIIEDEVVGRQYEFNATNVNRHKAFKETVVQSNLCVTPETKILTKEGYKEIGDMEGKQVDVWNGEQWSNVLVQKTGVAQEVIRVVTKDGYEIECTPYHKFYKVDKQHNSKPREVEVRAIDLKKGDKLVKFNLPVIEGSEHLDKAWLNGFHTGDGFQAKEMAHIYFYHDKRKLVDDVLHLADSRYIDEAQNRELLRVSGLKPKYFVPDCSYTIESRLEWLAGLLDSDGTLCFNGETQAFQIGSIDHEFLKQVQLMLQTCGVGSKVTKNVDSGMRPLPANDGSGESKLYMCQTSYRLLIGNGGVSKLQDLGLRTRRLKPTAHRPNRECSQFIKVEGVYSDGRISDTYCFNEPLRNRGMFNGILTGQCQELSEPTKPYEHITDLYKRSDEVEGEVAMCNLAAIPVGVVSLKQEDYEELAYRTLLMVDNTIDIAEIPLPHVDYTAKQRRSVMVGITDLAHAMADRGLFYSDIQGKNFIHRLAEMHAYSLIKASVRLAKEKGKCGWFHKTRYSEGWLPIDTYNKNVDKVHTQPLLCDWEGLRADILKHGMRNSALIGHMPCESSSIRNGDTNSLYPVREGVVTKVSGNTVNVFIAPEWERLQSFYELAWDVPYKDLIDMYAIVQKFTDQAISADIYHKFEKGKDKKVSLKMLLEQYFYRHDMGLKTRYYKNFATDIAIIEQEESCSGGSCKL